MIITIDGPVASGKSTAARNLAKALGFAHLDTGAIYRAVTLCAIEGGVGASDPPALRAMLDGLKVRFDGERVFLNGADVSDKIRTPAMTSAVRPYAENADVREFVKRIDRDFAAQRDIVVEGRDMGTVVFPDAELKIYLSATAEERARRRWEEFRAKGIAQDYPTVFKELQERDQADMTRKTAPLRKPEGAVEFNSTGLTQEETLEALLKTARAYVKEPS